MLPIDYYITVKDWDRFLKVLQTEKAKTFIKRLAEVDSDTPIKYEVRLVEDSKGSLIEKFNKRYYVEIVVYDTYGNVLAEIPLSKLIIAGFVGRFQKELQGAFHVEIK